MADPWRLERRFDRKQLVRDIRGLHDIARSSALVVHSSQAGPYEGTLVPSSSWRHEEQQRCTLERGNAIAVDGNNHLERLGMTLEQNGVTLNGLVSIAGATHQVQVEMLDLTAQNLTCAIASLSVLTDIERGVRNIQELQGITIDVILEVDARSRKEVREQGELTREEMSRQGELTRAVQLRVGEMIVDQMTKLGLSGRADIEWLSKESGRHTEQIVGAVNRVGDILTVGVRTKANELYQQALRHCEAFHPGWAIEALKRLFKIDKTHAPAWMLYGVLAEERYGQPALARAAYRVAATYAPLSKDMEGYVLAIVRLSRLERLVGNYERGMEVIAKALKAVKWGSPLCNVLRYEEVVALYADPHRTADLQKFADWLRKVLIADPSRREQVAKDPFWVDVVASDPYLRYGDAPFIRLAEIWMEVEPELKPCADPDVYAQVLDLCELGYRGRRSSVNAHLHWLQEYLLGGGSLKELMARREFASGYEQTLLCLFNALLSAGKSDEAWRVLQCGPTPEMFLPRVDFELFKHSIDGRDVEEEIVLRVKTELRRILRAAPELRDAVAREAPFTAYHERCHWLKTGNTPMASLIESLSVLRFSRDDEEERRIPSELWEPLMALRELCEWTEELISEPVAKVTGFDWRFDGDVQKVKALVGEVEGVIHRCADQMAWPRADGVEFDNEPYSIERWCAVVCGHQASIFLAMFMADPCECGWSDDHEELLNLLLKLDPSAQKKIDQSPFFARLRWVRAEQVKRKRDAELEALRQMDIHRAAEVEAARQQKEQERLEVLARQEAERKALADAEAVRRQCEEAERTAREAQELVKAKALAQQQKEKRARQRAENKKVERMKWVWFSVLTVLLAVLLALIGIFVPQALNQNSFVSVIVFVVYFATMFIVSEHFISIDIGPEPPRLEPFEAIGSSLPPLPKKTWLHRALELLFG